jgi:hypothetical protein
MKFRADGMLLALGACLMVAGQPARSAAQSLDPADLLKPPADSWPLYHGDYSGRRHSALKQITPENVPDLGLAWAFQTNQSATIKSSPLLVDGVLFFTVPDNVWAVDARSGQTVRCAGTRSLPTPAKATGQPWLRWWWATMSLQAWVAIWTTCPGSWCLLMWRPARRSGSGSQRRLRERRTGRRAE